MHVMVLAFVCGYFRSETVSRKLESCVKSRLMLATGAHRSKCRPEGGGQWRVFKNADPAPLVSYQSFMLLPPPFTA